MRAIILASCSLLVAGTTAAAQRYSFTSPQPTSQSQQLFFTPTTRDLARTLSGNALEPLGARFHVRSPADSVYGPDKTCPMPVLVPDSARSAPMPVATVDRDKLAPMPVIKPGCTNSLRK